MKTELARQRMMSNLVSRDVYNRDIDEIKQLMADALRRRDEESARQRELLQVTILSYLHGSLLVG